MSRQDQFINLIVGSLRYNHGKGLLGDSMTLILTTLAQKTGQHANKASLRSFINNYFVSECQKWKVIN